jgi:hypothetical protein
VGERALAPTVGRGKEHSCWRTNAVVGAFVSHIGPQLSGARLARARASTRIDVSSPCRTSQPPITSRRRSSVSGCSVAAIALSQPERVEVASTTPSRADLVLAIHFEIKTQSGSLAASRVRLLGLYDEDRSKFGESRIGLTHVVDCANVHAPKPGRAADYAEK